jgi:hypothetical protein
MAVGIIGEYVGKIYREVKRRPRYFIEQEVGGNNTIKQSDCQNKDSEDVL